MEKKCAELKTALVFLTFKKDVKGCESPLGIAYIASFLREAEKNIKVFDETFSTQEKILDRLKEYGPDMVGMTVTTMNVEKCFTFASGVKKILPDAKIVFGGPHPTIMPEHALRNENVDVAVVGEGELTALDLVNNFDNLKKVDGIYYKENGEIIVNMPREFIKNLDSLPYPARDLFDSRYFKSGNATITCVRGCPFNCSFCQPTLRKIFGNKTRFRTPKNVVDEIEHLVTNYKTKLLFFHDSTFTANKKWAMEICDEMIRRKVKLNWVCKNRVDTVDEEVLQKLREAGCTDIEYGVESGAEEIRNQILNKNTTNEQITNAFKWSYEVGIKPTAYIMVGSPFETKETLNKTIQLLKTIKPLHICVSITTPRPGTHLYDMCKKNDLINAKSFSDLDFRRNITLKHKSITKKDIRDAKRKIKTIAYSNYISYCIKNRRFNELLGAAGRDSLEKIREILPNLVMKK